MRTLIIGDIHGCIEELEQLLTDFGPQSDDEIISIGDIIHKGPDQDACLKLIRENSQTVILGNHEERQLRWENYEDERLLTGKTNPIKAGDYIRLPSVEREWLKDAKLFHKFTIKNDDYLLVHGGVLPKMNALPGVNQASKFSGRDRKFYFTMLRTRYVTPKGDMVSLGDETEVDRYWAEVYNGQLGTVIFGHQPWLVHDADLFQGVNNFKYAIGIDLGCVYGGYLAGLVLDSNGTRSALVVPSKHKYKEPMSFKE